MKIIVLGYIVRGPLGGLAWHHLQYVLGLKLLGHDVFFIEDSDDYPTCYDPTIGQLGTDPSYGLEFTREIFEHYGLGRRWAYYDAHTESWLGAAGSIVRSACTTAEILLNLSGLNRVRPWLSQIPIRVLIDTDPVFTQIRHQTEPARREFAEEHNRFYTFGANINESSSRIPDDGLPWEPTRQPVVLDAWNATSAPLDGPFTTVMQWESYSSGQFEGTHYGMKSESLWAIRELPMVTNAALEIAMGANPNAPVSDLEACGWKIRDAESISRSLASYAEYIQRSRGEFSVAKHGYVAAKSGWFSERTANYLASGRPSIVQDTGFGSWIETGLGLMKYTTVDEAANALSEVMRRYEAHSRAARDLAEAHFDSGIVLTELLENVFK